MSKNKSKLRWMYVTKPFDVHVDPDTVNRVHAPLEPSLSFLPRMTLPLRYPDGEFYLHLRPCVQGVDEYGAVVKYLYCTRDGRFFVRGMDGWDEELPSNASKPRNNGKCGGAYDSPSMSHFGHKYCHRCIAVAWCNPPEEALAEINDRHAKKKWQVDHLNTDHKNWSADNLQWVTVPENIRRAKIARRMRQIGLDPRLLTPTLCKGIYTLPQADEDWVAEFIERYKYHCSKCPLELSLDTIRLCVADALDNVKSQISNDHGSADRKK